MQVVYWPLEKLTPYARNSRTHSTEQIDQLVSLILEFGWTNPVLADLQGIVAGHGRVLAAGQIYSAGKGIRLPGGDPVPAGTVPVVDCTGWTEAQRRAYIIADNASAERAGWDYDILRLELKDLQDLDFSLELTGLEQLVIDDLLRHIEPTTGLTDPDEVPDVPVEPVTRPGDLWQLGHHRLLCGDSTSIDCLQTLFGGETADMVFTDPPYNVDYKGGTKDALKILNDKMTHDDFYRFLFDCFSAAASVVSPGTPIYVCHSDSEGINFRKSLIDSGWLVKNCLNWVKNHFNLGRMDYHMRHEPILYGWKAGGPHRWYGGRKQDSIIEEMPGLRITPTKDGAEIFFGDGIRFCSLKVPSYEVVSTSDDAATSIWKVDKPLRNAEHPTIKPVAIPARAIENSSRNGDRILDSFLGSGTTLIACEQTGRICYGLELDPKYCDVIIRRWEQFTGKEAVRA